jgi:thioredoxin-like negative regulator of GroEL
MIGAEILVFGFTKGCPQCDIYKKQLEQGEISYQFIDVAQNEELTNDYNIISVPTTVILRNGHMVAKRSGAMSVKKLNDIISEFAS